jgi:hypothetical protein
LRGARVIHFRWYRDKVEFLLLQVAVEAL